MKTGDTGNDGSGQTAAFIDTGGDMRAAGLAFTSNPNTYEYENLPLDVLGQLSFAAPFSLDSITSISLYAGSIPIDIASVNPYSFIFGAPKSNYVGSLSVVVSSVPAEASLEATPSFIAAAAQAMIGSVTNANGCWVLESTIADKAGVALPVESVAAGAGGQSNGQWKIAYNGSVKPTLTGSMIWKLATLLIS